MESRGLSSDYLSRLCEICLSNPPEILACDNFYSKPYLPENSSYIVNIQKSDLPGSHWISILVKKDCILYFDSMGLPVINEYISKRLELCNCTIYYSRLSIQGIFSMFCAYYTLAFLIKCHEEKRSFKDFLENFKHGKSLENEQICLNMIKRRLTQ